LLPLEGAHPIGQDRSELGRLGVPRLRPPIVLLALALVGFVLRQL
jgi:hypothetical protein